MAKKIDIPWIATPGYIHFCKYCQLNHELTEEFFYFFAKRLPQCKATALTDSRRKYQRTQKNEQYKKIMESGSLEEIEAFKKKRNETGRKSYHYGPNNTMKEKRKLQREENKRNNPKPPKQPKPIKVKQKSGIQPIPRNPTPNYMKYCTHCLQSHELIEDFFIFKNEKLPICKIKHEAKKKYEREYKKRQLQSKTPEERKIFNIHRANIRNENPEAYKKRMQEYAAKNRDRLNKNAREYRKNNPEKAKIYYARNKEAIKRRKKKDPAFKLGINIRRRLKLVLQKGEHIGKLGEAIGCDLEFLRQHIESKFKPGMGWDIPNSFHLDHIIPLAFFGSNLKENLNIAMNWKNLQPLYPSENIAKKDLMLNYQYALLEEIKHDLGIA